jgi:hypothetical protein
MKFLIKKNKRRIKTGVYYEMRILQTGCVIHLFYL